MKLFNILRSKLRIVIPSFWWFHWCLYLLTENAHCDWPHFNLRNFRFWPENSLSILFSERCRSFVFFCQDSWHPNWHFLCELQAWSSTDIKYPIVKVEVGMEHKNSLRRLNLYSRTSEFEWEQPWRIADICVWNPFYRWQSRWQENGVYVVDRQNLFHLVFGLYVLCSNHNTFLANLHPQWVQDCSNDNAGFQPKARGENCFRELFGGGSMLLRLIHALMRWVRNSLFKRHFFLYHFRLDRKSVV